MPHSFLLISHLSPPHPSGLLGSHGQRGGSVVALAPTLSLTGTILLYGKHNTYLLLISGLM